MYKIICIIYICLAIVALPVNAKDRADSALIKALKHNNVDAATEAIAFGANVESKKMGSTTPLTYAALHNEHEIVKLLVDSGADVNRYDASMLPLHAASMIDNSHGRSKFKIVEFLLSKGAKIDAKDRAGNTALMLAIKSNLYDIARLLVESGANPNRSVVNKAGDSAISIAEAVDSLKLNKLLQKAVDKIVTDRNNAMVQKFQNHYDDFFTANLSGKIQEHRKTRTQNILNQMSAIYKKKGKLHLMPILVKEIAQKQEKAIKNGKFIPSRISSKYNLYNLTHNFKKARLVYYSQVIADNIYILAIMFQNEDNFWKIDHIGATTINDGQKNMQLVEERIEDLISENSFRMR